MDISELYRQNLQRANKKNPDVRKWKGKPMEGKDLEFFKGISSQIKNEASNIMAQGYDTNRITKLEKMLGDFTLLYNAYYEQITRNPQNKMSQPMRDIIDELKKVLIQIQGVAPEYADRLQEKLNELNDMYRRTGGVKVLPQMKGGGLGTYNGDLPVNVEYYEPTLEERIANQKFLPLWRDKPYMKLQMNDDFN